MKISAKLMLISLVILSFCMGILQFIMLFFSDLKHFSFYLTTGILGLVMSHLINQEILTTEEKKQENETLS